jgi:phosphomannomutase
MKISESIFKAYDIRGKVGSELTLAVAEAVGRAVADFLPTAGPVCVGYDMRPDSQELAAAARAGLRRQGRKVIDIGEVASDMIYFAVGYLEAAGGIMVTASHNPGADDGMKLCAAGARPIGIETGLAEIRDAVVADQYKPEMAGGAEDKRDIMEAWITHALGFIKPQTLRPYRIAVDAGNGMAGAVVPHLAGKWPLTVEPLFFELDGTFPNHIANPLIDANNRFLIAKIKEDKLDFGAAFDGDGDRAFLVDDLGRTVPGHIMSAILAEHFARLNPGANIIYGLTDGRLVEEVVAEHGGHSIRSRVGHSFIKQLMRQYDAPFGCEFSGHFYFKDNFYADSGLIAMLVGIQVLSDSGQKLSQIVDDYSSRYARSPETNFEVADKAAKIAELKKLYADGAQDELDGLTVNYPDWWFNVRPSNTEPLLRLNVEARTPEKLAAELDKLDGLLKRTNDIV